MKASWGTCCKVLISAFVVVASANDRTAPDPDPTSSQYQKTGEQDRSYDFPGTGEKIAYHLYVPTNWTASMKLPLVIVTHGAGQPPTAPFQRPIANPTLAKMAEERGYIVAAVTGYHANATGVGGWNVPYPMVTVPRPARPPAASSQPAPAPPTVQDLSAPSRTCCSSPTWWRRSTTPTRSASI